MKRAVCIMLSAVMTATLFMGCGNQIANAENDVISQTDEQGNAVSQTEKRKGRSCLLGQSDVGYLY